MCGDTGTHFSSKISSRDRKLTQAGMETLKLPMWKRAIDLWIGGLALLLALPVMIIVAVLIRIRMGSPVFFRQARPGVRGKSFTLLKFRTMTQTTTADGSLLPDSARLTGVGRMIRRFSLDELPQLVNVVLGDMSLVGPRPLLVEYLPHYTERESARHLVRPGITGLAQVSGRNSLSWDDRLELDARYVENLSPALDLRILGLTVLRTLRSEGVSEDTQRSEGNLARIRGNESKP